MIIADLGLLEWCCQACITPYCSQLKSFCKICKVIVLVWHASLHATFSLQASGQKLMVEPVATCKKLWFWALQCTSRSYHYQDPIYSVGETGWPDSWHCATGNLGERMRWQSCPTEKLSTAFPVELLRKTCTCCIMVLAMSLSRDIFKDFLTLRLRCNAVVRSWTSRVGQSPWRWKAGCGWHIWASFFKNCSNHGLAL